ncbi:hypothetical protein [Methylobacterium marchantiae]|uniref:hypothetical protein n=1 Tax=Methylobacterium marchantiae TaxID=600331 RepID=UPI001EDE43C4|nr:hypothetical protein AIGOOFII_3403 [Methylobacterium marchantiae]
MPSPCLHLVGTGHPPCGVGDFAGQLIEALRCQGQPQETLVLEPGRVPLGEIWRVVGRARAVVANLPLVPWKRALVGPPSAFAIALLRRRRRVAILHEWGGMHRLRRLVLRPLLLLADTIVLLSPQVREELAADPLIGRLARRAVMMPLPPNIARPTVSARSSLSERMRAARAEGRLVLGHFGSIYPGKQPEAILDIAASLKARGGDPLVVFIGSFIRASDGIEEIFWNKIATLGLAETVVVSGYVASPEELFGLFDEVDAFAYVLPEGLTARRASVLACVQAGRPVIVTEPKRADEFDHHPRFRALLAGGAIVAAPAGAGPEAYADLVLAAAARPTLPPKLDRQIWFADAARSLREILG